MTARQIRIAKRFASVALSVNCQSGSPKRRASSSPAQAASSVGSIAVIPAAARSATARTTGAGACPAIAPVSPRQRSTYSCPSTSTTRAPFASARKSGYGPAQRIIHVIGTPPSSDPRARSASARERGRTAAKASASRAVSAASRPRSTPTPASSTSERHASFTATCLMRVYSSIE